MKTIEHIKLIDGSFTTEEAKEILLTALDFKINFHQLRNLRSIENTGQADPRSTSRIEELKVERQKFLRFLADHQDLPTTMKIRGGFELAIENQEVLSV